MSKIFYDHLIAFDDVAAEIKGIVETQEEKEELWEIVDGIVHNKVLEYLLDMLPGEHHDDFLDKFHRAPHDESLIDYLKEKANENIDELLKEEIGGLAYEILKEIKSK